MKPNQKLTIQLPPPILEALLTLDAQIAAVYRRVLRNGTPEPRHLEQPLSITDKLRVIVAYTDRLPTDQREVLRACCAATRHALRCYDEFVVRYSPVAVRNPPMTAVIEVTGWLATISYTWKVMLRGDRASGGVSVRIWSSSPPVFLV